MTQSQTLTPSFGVGTGAGRVVRAVFTASAFGFLAFSCLPSASSSKEAVAVTGDHLYSGVLAGTGGPSSSGTLQALYLDPANAGASPAEGPRGSDLEMIAKVRLGLAVAVVRGTMSNGQGTLSGLGWTLNVQIQPDGSLQGTYTGGDSMDGGPSAAGASGNLAAVDNSDAAAKTLCGTYDGSGSGTWNFVIGGDGNLAGSFYGAASGNLTGSSSGDSVSINWSGDSGFGAVAGTASGTLTSDHSSVQGTWQSGDNSLSGTFSSDTVTCGQTDPPPEHSADPPSGGSCPCSHAPLPAGGACCEGGPVGNYCCAAFQ